MYGHLQCTVLLFQLRNHILYLIENYQTVVIVGETGCGKSTQLPQVSMDLGLCTWIRLEGFGNENLLYYHLHLYNLLSERKYSTQLDVFIELLGFIISLISTEVTVFNFF